MSISTFAQSSLGVTEVTTSGNAIINGAFDINQRRLTSTTASDYHFDRWRSLTNTGIATQSAQTFVPGEEPAPGFRARNFLRTVVASQSGSGAYAINIHPVEDVRSFAGQTVTVSFYARAASGNPRIAVELWQYFGTGGSPSASTPTLGGLVTLSNSWARYSVTATVPSLAGKVIGTNNNSILEVNFWYSAGSDFNSRTGSLGIQSGTFEIWGAQLEAGTVATPFKRNAPSIQAELAACQRYYTRVTAGEGAARFAYGHALSASGWNGLIVLPTPMRSTPTVSSSGSASLSDGATAYITFGINGALSRYDVTLQASPTNVVPLNVTGVSNLPAFRPLWLEVGNADTATFIQFNSEL